MAERRMFAKTIIDSDAFLDMPLSTQALYFHLSMRADDEGFVNNPKKIQRMVGASDDDIKVLLAKNFVIAFESGVIVIKHWKIHNYIRGDRISETKYQEEKALLEVKDNGAYTISQEINKIESLDASDIRKIAYKESSLPYSFSYKIKRAFDGKICPVCSNTMTTSYRTLVPSIQHNIPISKGGKHELDNISVICASCNCSIRDNETGELNNAEVVRVWDKIIWAEKNNIDWFKRPEVLEESECQTYVSQMSVKCQSNVGIGKESIGKDSIDKDNTNTIRACDDDFEKFWNLYPRKQGRGMAEHAWARVNPNQETFKKIMYALQANVDRNPQWKRNIIPNPATWLDEKRWLDATEWKEDPKKVDYEGVMTEDDYNAVILKKLRGG